MIVSKERQLTVIFKLCKKQKLYMADEQFEQTQADTFKTDIHLPKTQQPEPNVIHFGKHEPVRRC